MFFQVLALLVWGIESCTGKTITQLMHVESTRNKVLPCSSPPSSSPNLGESLESWLVQEPASDHSTPSRNKMLWMIISLWINREGPLTFMRQNVRCRGEEGREKGGRQAKHWLLGQQQKGARRENTDRSTDQVVLGNHSLEKLVASLREPD